MECVRFFGNYIITQKAPLERAGSSAKRYIKQLQNFVLWHYQFGSKYDTPFWDYAKVLSFKDSDFDALVSYVKNHDFNTCLPQSHGGGTHNDCQYGQWPAFSFKIWYDGMTRRKEK